MVPPRSGLRHGHAVAAYQPVDHGHDADRAAPGLAVADHDTGLHHVSGDNLRGEPRVDHLEVQIVLGDLRAHELRSGHLSDDGQYSGGNLEVVNAAVASAEEGPRVAVDGTEHPLLRLFPEPTVDVVRQQLRVLRAHPLIILARNVQVGADLLMSGLANVQRFHKVLALVVQHPQQRRTATRLHVDAGRVDEIVSLGLVLTVDFRRQLLNGLSCLHVVLSFFFFHHAI